MSISHALQYAAQGGKLIHSRREAHKGPIHVLCNAGFLPSGGTRLLSCGKDGCVRLWHWVRDGSGTLEPLLDQMFSFVGSGLNELCLDDGLAEHCGIRSGARLRSMDWLEGRLLLGTHASELLFVGEEPENCGSLMHGHAQRPIGTSSSTTTGAVALTVDDCDEESGAVRSIAVVPGALVCATGGDDATVRLWDLQQRRQMARVPVVAAVCSLAFDTSAGSILRLAVGYEDGGWEVLRVTLPLVEGKKGFDGMSTRAFERTYSHRDPAGGLLKDGPRRRVTDMRFSPDVSFLAVGCADSVIYLYDAWSFQQRAQCRGHSSAITHLDWSEDSNVLRSNCQGHELRFWEVHSGQQIAVASACANLPWATFSVTLGWHCQGIFRNRADGTGVQCVDRSADGMLLATADDFGVVNLHRYPCVLPQSKLLPSNRSEFTGHASAALTCRWASADDPDPNSQDEFLLSGGGLDLTVFQWYRRRHRRSEHA